MVHGRGREGGGRREGGGKKEGRRREEGGAAKMFESSRKRRGPGML